MTNPNNQLNKPMREEWEIKFDILAINLGMDGEQMDEIRDFIRQLLSQTKSQIVEQILGELEKEFLYYLTTNFVTDARKKDFNQAIFDKDEGWACFNGTDLGMIMDKFHKSVKKLRLQIKEEINKL